MVVIDSFKALTPFADDARVYRLFLHQLAGYLTATAGTSFWLGEYSQDEAATAPEFAVADSVISLCSRTVGERSERVLEVLKLRGSSYASGQHGYRLSGGGLDVFPRLADDSDDSGYALGAERVSTGIALLDVILADGYWPGSSTLVAGPSGIGKTLMGLQFVSRGAELGEPGIVASLQENPSQIGRVAAGFSWNLDGPVEIIYRSPVDLYIDEWIYELLEETDRDRRQTGADRQPDRPSARSRRRGALSRVHVLADAAVLARGHQPDDDVRAARPVHHHPPV